MRASGLLLVAACAGPPEESPLSTPTVALEPCRIIGLDVEAHCADLPVEDGSLRITVIDPVSSAPRPDPLFVVDAWPAGGSTAHAEDLARVVAKVRSRRAIVLFDPRATSTPGPACTIDPPLWGDPLLSLQHVASMDPSCRFDPEAASTATAAEDIDRIRQALGYEQINVLGLGFGTRPAMAWLTAHPDHARSAILDGFAPGDLPLFADLDAHGARALDATLDACAADEACAAEYGDVRARFDAIRPEPFSPMVARVNDPRTGMPIQAVFDRDGFDGLVRAALYDPQRTAMLPYAIGQAHEDHWQPILALGTVSRHEIAEHTDTAAMLATLCPEDLPAAGTRDATTALAVNFRGACSNWGVRPGAPVPTPSVQAPTLLLSGGIDPVFPAHRTAETAPERLHNYRHAIAPGAGHGVATEGCTPYVIAAFLDTADPAELDIACIEAIERPGFFIGPLGPTP